MRKLIILLVMAICLVSAVSFIAAEDVNIDTSLDTDDDSGVTADEGNLAVSADDNDVNTNEKVKLTISVDWKDNDGANRPTSITVYVKNGENTVETVVLSGNGNWVKTVDVDKYDGSGNEISYSVSSDKLSGYKEPVVTKNNDNIKITYELKDNNSSDVNKNVDNKNTSTDKHKKAVSNSTKTKNKTDVNNTTIKNTNINNTTINNTTINNNTTVNNTTNNVIVKNPVNETPKNDSKNKTKGLLNTGNPILILVVVVVVIAVAYYFYNKR